MPACLNAIRRLAVAAIVATIAPGVAVGVDREKQTIDVDAILKIATLGDSDTLGMRGDSSALAHQSPDGKWIAVVSQTGDPEHDVMRGRILLYQTDRLLTDAYPVEPQILGEFTSSSNDRPVSALKWIDDKNLIFAAVRGGSLAQIYRLNVDTRELTQLTQETRPIRAFAYADNGQGLLLVRDADPPIPPDQNPTCLAHGCLVTAKRLPSAITGTGPGGAAPGALVFYNQAGVRRDLTSLYSIDGIKECVPNDFIPGGISPDGRYALFFCYRASWPDWWTAYKVDPRFSAMIAKGNTQYSHQYVLLDVQENKVRPLNSAPFLRFASPFDPLWIDGGKRLLLAGAVEPLDVADAAERKRRSERLGLVEVDPATGRTKFQFAIDHNKYRRIDKASWDQASRVLTVDAIKANGEHVPMAWQKGRRGWTQTVSRATVADTSPVKLRLVQSPNDRPILHASKPGGEQGRAIYDPNPWLDGYTLGRVEEMSWRSAGDHRWEGAIYYPPNYQPGRRYPLVILTHGVNLGVFSPYGVARNYAAQPLASKDIIVLQMNEKGVDDVVTSPKELPRSQQGIESAIDEMDRRGLIDRNKVGLVGWSRTSWYVNYMATHSDYPIGATMQTDGGDLGWWTYLLEGVLDETEADLGEAPFGAGLKPMLDAAPTFSLHRWRAPMLIWEAGDVGYSWDIFAGLRRVGTPVEYWHFPDGTHDLLKISHRRVGGQLMVDWFDFWLNGREDPSPAKADQYQRWRGLRGQAAKLDASPRPPLLEWTPTEKSK